jgi:hypothetical protein
MAYMAYIKDEPLQSSYNSDNSLQSTAYSLQPLTTDQHIVIIDVAIAIAIAIAHI